ncbi:hypothetical protein E2C01_067470 [Portunus trituberculatus]|uniref:Uncharacterized protein n=1 Tax=Portunus trituberculatus TaxID=210409 RepID=A0A5B7HP72_PORTR|nr:hypothetical protein [Portunus trituberculatus]
MSSSWPRSHGGRQRVRPADGSTHCLGSPAANTPGHATFYIRCKFTSGIKSQRGSTSLPPPGRTMLPGPRRRRYLRGGVTQHNYSTQQTPTRKKG